MVLSIREELGQTLLHGKEWQGERKTESKERILAAVADYNFANEYGAPKFLHAIWKNPFSTMVNNC